MIFSFYNHQYTSSRLYNFNICNSWSIFWFTLQINPIVHEILMNFGLKLEIKSSSFFFSIIFYYGFKLKTVKYFFNFILLIVLIQDLNFCSKITWFYFWSRGSNIKVNSIEKLHITFFQVTAKDKILSYKKKKLIEILSNNFWGFTF